MRALLGLALAALAPPVAARLLAEEAEDETEEEVRHYAIAIGVGLLGVTFVVLGGPCAPVLLRHRRVAARRLRTCCEGANQRAVAA